MLCQKNEWFATCAALLKMPPAGGLSDDGLQRELFKLGPLDQLVEVVEIRLMMLAVVVLHGLDGDVRRQCVLRIRQLGQFVFHDSGVLVDPESGA
jgi:hypothetical protein